MSRTAAVSAIAIAMVVLAGCELVVDDGTRVVAAGDAGPDAGPSASPDGSAAAPGAGVAPAPRPASPACSPGPASCVSQTTVCRDACKGDRDCKSACSTRCEACVAQAGCPGPSGCPN